MISFMIKMILEAGGLLAYKLRSAENSELPGTKKAKNQ